MQATQKPRRTKIDIQRQIVRDWGLIVRLSKVPDDIAKAVRLPKTPHILGESTKVKKGEKDYVLTSIAYLSPSTESGRNTCFWATIDCADACLGKKSGRLTLDSSKNSRVWKTILWFGAQSLFVELAEFEIESLRVKAEKLKMEPAARLDGSSDLSLSMAHLPMPHSNAGKPLAQALPKVQFYDYTKSVERALRFARGGYPDNVHYTFSRSGKNDKDCLRVLEAGGNVAVVFNLKPGETMPTGLWVCGKWFPVFDADETDIRFRDPCGQWAGLSFKVNTDREKAAKEAGVFLVDPDSTDCTWTLEPRDQEWINS